MYAKIINGAVEAYPYTLDDLRSENPNTSFPSSLPNDRLAEWNVHPVIAIGRPDVDHTKNLIEGLPSFNNGRWEQVWIVSDASAEEIAARVAAQWNVVRAERNAILSSCDWTQVDDAPLTNVQKADWATYRQELRDIPSTQTDPFNIVWPQEPS